VFEPPTIGSWVDPCTRKVFCIRAESSHRGRQLFFSFNESLSKMAIVSDSFPSGCPFFPKVVGSYFLFHCRLPCSGLEGVLRPSGIHREDPIPRRTARLRWPLKEVKFLVSFFYLFLPFLEIPPARWEGRAGSCSPDPRFLEGGRVSPAGTKPFAPPFPDSCSYQRRLGLR